MLAFASLTPHSLLSKQKTVLNQKTIEGLIRDLPGSHQPYTDKYFLRTNSIAKKEGLNPVVRAQVFIRKGPGEIHGVDKVVAILKKYSNFFENGGKMYSMQNGEIFEPGQALMVFEGRFQDLVELETMYLGVLSQDISKAAGVEPVSFYSIERNVETVKQLIGERPLYYLGSRHMGYGWDAAITEAAFRGGASGSSTDIGARTRGQKGMGTIPHALENLIAAKYGKNRAVVEATCAFDQHISAKVPRIALVDYNNREIEDTLETAHAMGDRLSGIRIDTCGENIMQGAIPSSGIYLALRKSLETDQPIDNFLPPEEREIFEKRKADLPHWIRTVRTLIENCQNIPSWDYKFWFGTGVSISGVYAVNTALKIAGFSNVEIGLSSGFGKIDKVRAFVRAEELLGTPIFDWIGAGTFFKSWTTTMDITHVADSFDDLDQHPVHKVGRKPKERKHLGEITVA